jgi:hypothetical protein
MKVKAGAIIKPTNISIGVTLSYFAMPYMDIAVIVANHMVATSSTMYISTPLD